LIETGKRKNGDINITWPISIHVGLIMQEVDWSYRLLEEEKKIPWKGACIYAATEFYFYRQRFRSLV